MYQHQEWVQLAVPLMQLCKSGDHIVSSRTIYGGTYAFMKNFLPRLNISTSFVDTTNLKAVKSAICQTQNFIL